MDTIMPNNPPADVTVMPDDADEAPVLHIVDEELEPDRTHTDEPIPSPKAVDEPPSSECQPTEPSEEPHAEPEDIKPVIEIPNIPDMAAESVQPHRSVIVPLSSFTADNESSITSVRSESVNSSGSCEREATASPLPSRRYSTRLRTERPNTRKSAEKGDHETEDDHHEDSEATDSKSGTASTSRKRSNSNKSDYALRNIAPERQMNPELNVMWDGFCWRCHKPVPLAEQHGCPLCVRIFHRECWWNDSPYNSKDVLDSHPVHAAFGHNLDREPDDTDPTPPECIECYCVLEEEKKDDNISNRVGPDKLRKYLQYMMRFVDDHLPPERVRPFAVPVLEQDDCSDSVKAKYAEYITRPMDLRQIGQNISEGKYITCASFLADLRWIYHNTSIFNGQNNRYTRSAFYIVETCQHLCYSLEWCMECFERGMPVNGETIHEAVERGMITPCSDPHAVVWVKADKFPIWPAIVYRFNGSVADVRFFGAFEFGVFPKDAIFLFSKGAVTDRRKGRLKLDYENALRQFRLHVAKLRAIPGKELISYPKRTRYDGRLWMFPEGEDASLLVTGPGSISGDYAGSSITTEHAGDDEMDPLGHDEEENAKTPPGMGMSEQIPPRPRSARESEKRSRSGSPSDDSSSSKHRKLSPVPEPLESSASVNSPPVDSANEDIVMETLKLEPLVVTEINEMEIPLSPAEVAETVALSRTSTMSGADKPEETGEVVADVVVEEATVASPKVDSAGSLPHTPTETVKPAFFESDSDNDASDLPSFEFPDDGDDRVPRPAGKLDHILKKPVPSPDPAQMNLLSSVGLAVRNTGLTQELNKSLPSTTSSSSSNPPKSVLHDALVRPFPASQSDVLASLVRRSKAPSMAASQSHLIEALRSSPRPSGAGEGTNARKEDGPDAGGWVGPGTVARQPSREEQTPVRREETLGSLLAAGTQRVGLGRSPSYTSRPSSVEAAPSPLTTTARQLLPKPDSVAVGHDQRTGLPDGRRINAVSNQLNNLAAARNAQARNNQGDSGSVGSHHSQLSPPGPDQSLQRSPILARSLNAPSLTPVRSGQSVPSGSLNGMPSNLRNGGLDSNGDRASPAALQTAMRSLVSARATNSPVAPDSLRNVTLPPTQQPRRLTPPENPAQMPAESVQAQIDLFLRNTKKIVKDKRDETAQVIRETSQTHADNLRLLHDAQLKIQQRTEKMTQELQETMEQSIRKFELLFMVFHNESDFAQKSKILEVSRMKDLERQRAVTSAKRTLWCCVCQKRARMICCGVTMYCSENCHLNNASLHRLHCRRVNSSAEDDGNVYTPYGVLVRCSLLPALGLDEEDDMDAGGGDLSGANPGMHSGNSYLGNNGWNNGRNSADPVEVIDVEQDDNMND